MTEFTMRDISGFVNEVQNSLTQTEFSDAVAGCHKWVVRAVQMLPSSFSEIDEYLASFVA